MSYVLEVEHLTKRYGDKTALHDVGFNIAAGSCFGLLGPNGAGKSTTMKIITGIIEADGGEVRVFGNNTRTNRDDIRKKIGYVPQEITLYDKISAKQNLVFFGEMYGVRGAELKKRIKEVLEKVGLSDRADDPVRTFSGGMKRRINIAAALLHNPQIVILDEPTVGIDPQSRNHIFEMIRQLKKSGVTIIYSTHYMEEVEALCDDIAIIDHGKVIVQGELQQLLDRYAIKAVYLEGDGLHAAPAISGVTRASENGKGWLLETDDVLATLEQTSMTMKKQGILVKALEIMRPSLESVFLSLTGTTLRD